MSITEQVESEVLKILKGYEYFVQRIDSKSTNTRFDDIQKELDENPSEKLLQELEALEFQDDTFGYPFIITTFVRIFETLLGNKNHELMKLPNFPIVSFSWTRYSLCLQDCMDFCCLLR